MARSGWTGLLMLMCWLSGAFQARAAGTSGFSPEVKQAILGIDEIEPSIIDVQAAGLRFFKIDPETVESMRNRAGWKSVMPAVTGKYRRADSLIDLDKWDLIQFPDRLAGKDYADYTLNEFEVSGSWDLARLVFNPEVLDVASLVVLQESILKELTRIYYTRRRLQLDLVLSPPTDEATLLSKELRVDELTATIDAMTGGYFSRTIEANQKRKAANGTQRADRSGQD